MNELMTIDEIRSRYDSEWVLLADLETKPTLEVTKGRVLWHSKDRDEVHRKTLELRPGYFTVLFTGEFPRDHLIFL
jgi:hypothetical protein